MQFLFVCSFFVLGAAADAPAPATPAAAAYQALAAEYDGTLKDVVAHYRSVKSDEKIDEEARRYRARVHQLGEEYSPRFLAIAERYPKDPIAVDALVRAAGLGAGESPASEKALGLLERDQLANGKVREVVTDVAYSKWPGAERFLRAVVEKNTDRAARGLAAYRLAHRLRERANEELAGDEADRASREAEALYQLVLAKYGDVADEKKRPLKGLADAGLTELHRLAVGKAAPEIEGEDGDGRPLKLSDYRGKVVVLDFWGHWCPDCRAVYPRQRALAKRFGDKPFVLLGVNSDVDRAVLKQTLAKRGVTWRYWWDGGSRQGPIATAWNIQAWPTIYVIDQRGVIRYKGHEELADKLEQLVDGLLKEGNQAAGGR